MHQPTTDPKINNQEHLILYGSEYLFVYDVNSSTLSENLFDSISNHECFALDGTTSDNEIYSDSEDSDDVTGPYHEIDSLVANPMMPIIAIEISERVIFYDFVKKQFRLVKNFDACGNVISFCFSFDGKRFYLSSMTDCYTIREYDVASLKEIRVLNLAGSAYKMICSSDNNFLIYFGEIYRMPYCFTDVTIMDLATGVETIIHDRYAISFNFVQNTTLAICERKSTRTVIRLYNCITGKIRTVVEDDDYKYYSDTDRYYEIISHPDNELYCSFFKPRSNGILGKIFCNDYEINEFVIPYDYYSPKTDIFSSCFSSFDFNYIYTIVSNTNGSRVLRQKLSESGELAVDRVLDIDPTIIKDCDNIISASYPMR